VFRSHLLDDFSDRFQRKPIEGVAVRSRCHVSRGRFDPFVREDGEVLLGEQPVELLVHPFPVRVQLT
jgi:hypothetical protein